MKTSSSKFLHGISVRHLTISGYSSAECYQEAQAQHGEFRKFLIQKINALSSHPTSSFSEVQRSAGWGGVGGFGEHCSLGAYLVRDNYRQANLITVTGICSDLSKSERIPCKP